jgi:hypothetical protein
MIKISTILNDNLGNAWFFVGKHIFRFDIQTDKADKEFKALITEIWPSNYEDNIDSVVLWGNGMVYFFKGEEYNKYELNTKKLEAGYPLSIEKGWITLPWKGKIDAYVQIDGFVYWFKGGLCQKMSSDEKCLDEPKPINEYFPGIWNDGIDAVLNLGNGIIYFFKDNLYFRFSVVKNKADKGYPKEVTDKTWPGLISAINSVMSNHNLQEKDPISNSKILVDEKQINTDTERLILEALKMKAEAEKTKSEAESILNEAKLLNLKISLKAAQEIKAIEKKNTEAKLNEAKLLNLKNSLKAAQEIKAIDKIKSIYSDKKYSDVINLFEANDELKKSEDAVHCYLWALYKNLFELYENKGTKEKALSLTKEYSTKFNTTRWESLTGHVLFRLGTTNKDINLLNETILYYEKAGKKEDIIETNKRIEEINIAARKKTETIDKIKSLYSDKKYSDVIHLFEANDELKKSEDAVDYYVWALYMNKGTTEKALSLTKEYSKKFNTKKWELLAGHILRWLGTTNKDIILLNEAILYYEKAGKKEDIIETNKRIEEIYTAEKERIAAEKEAERERIATEKNAEKQRKAAEKEVAADKKNSQHSFSKFKFEIEGLKQTACSKCGTIAEGYVPLDCIGFHSFLTSTQRCSKCGIHVTDICGTYGGFYVPGKGCG